MRLFGCQRQDRFLAHLANHLGSRLKWGMKFTRKGHPINPTNIARFWSKVQRTDGCWLWIGTITPNGYGRVSIGGKGVGAHRFAYAITHGDIPEGHFVCHRCDNPRCVRPEHLFAALPLQNTADMMRKDRHAFVGGVVGATKRRGSRNASTKLGEQDVLAIWERLRLHNESYAVIARDYGVRAATIHAIKSGTNWSWLTTPEQFV